MESQRVFVKPNLVVEPLFNRWYAWPYLISPAASALYLANQHLKILQSFVSAPQVHAKALQDRKMIGGPFVDHPVARVGEIRALMESTVVARSQALAFAKAVRELHDVLAENADGHSLEPLYSRVPESLRGYVELVYDLSNAPSVRFMEGLLYRSGLFDESGQSVTMFLTEADGRPFAFSTPRLPSPASLDLQIRFSDPRLDELSRARFEPTDYRYMKELLGVDEESEPTFATFFTAQPPATSRYDLDGVRIRYFGHACVLIETAQVSVLCDPVIGYGYEQGAPRFTYADLPDRIDYVLITHNHQDHCALETLLQLRHRIGTILVPKSNPGALADPSLRMALKSIGFAQVQEVEEMERIEIEGGAVSGIPFLGEHGDLNIQSKSAFVVELNGRSIVMAADSNNLEPRVYENLASLLPRVDVLFIGLECEGAPLSWVYGPLMMRSLSRSMDQSRRFDGSDSAKAAQIVEILKPSRAYVYAMGLEPWLTYMLAVDASETSYSIQESQKFVGLCRERGIESERLYCKKEIVLTAA
ncbi:MBL fold metallo-hydrolase [Lysobacter enzymogenes]|uniref:MBL fold metallo-hydrolase n=1 Tax=Lysobacter enzymogenes TaxID=69 RepID=UPI00099B7E5F|nr:MBL fold metallo-hydrolase [Lysobacter enzymogenes]UZW58378.1 MBL fold metallo-hydrolase [Lysobacter enzymogenes]